MVKVIFIGIVAILAGLLLKEKKPEYSLLVNLAACVLILLFATSQLTMIVTEIRRIVRYIELPKGYFTLLMKVLGISFLAEFGAALCKDSGQGAVASAVELCGKLMILVISMPVITALFETLTNIMF